MAFHFSPLCACDVEISQDAASSSWVTVVLVICLLILFLIVLLIVGLIWRSASKHFRRVANRRQQQRGSYRQFLQQNCSHNHSCNDPERAADRGKQCSCLSAHSDSNIDRWDLERPLYLGQVTHSFLVLMRCYAHILQQIQGDYTGIMQQALSLVSCWLSFTERWLFTLVH